MGAKNQIQVTVSPPTAAVIGEKHVEVKHALARVPE